MDAVGQLRSSRRRDRSRKHPSLGVPVGCSPAAIPRDRQPSARDQRAEIPRPAEDKLDSKAQSMGCPMRRTRSRMVWAASGRSCPGGAPRFDRSATRPVPPGRRSRVRPPAGGCERGCGAGAKLRALCDPPSSVGTGTSIFQFASKVVDASRLLDRMARCYSSAVGGFLSRVHRASGSRADRAGEYGRISRASAITLDVTSVMCGSERPACAPAPPGVFRCRVHWLHVGVV